MSKFATVLRESLRAVKTNRQIGIGISKTLSKMPNQDERAAESELAAS